MELSDHQVIKKLQIKKNPDEALYTQGKFSIRCMRSLARIFLLRSANGLHAQHNLV